MGDVVRSHTAAELIRGYPSTSDRTRGWLRYLYRKATTPDNWDKEGEPHAHWDAVTGPPVHSWHRFDLTKSCYALPLMADRTPAWREVYGKILDELIVRYTGYWTAKDWLEQIGHDPKRKNYPEEWYQAFIPKFLRGEYDVPGWTANGIEPWGLQMDPIGADGNLFFKGDFLLLLGFYVYITGDEKWNQPFQMVRNGPDTFTWTHSKIAEYLFAQMRAHPEGCHCENTKIWPLCMSRAGLGLSLHDLVYGTEYRLAFDTFWEYARRNYLSIHDGKVVGPVMAYYDPLLPYHHMGDHIPTISFSPAFGVLPLFRDDARALFESEIERLNWRILPIGKAERKFNVQELLQGLFLARELGDTALAGKLTGYAEATYGPVWDKNTGEFAWEFGLDEAHPRGQMNALAALAEVVSPGSWWGIINQPNLRKLVEPTVYGVDFPKVCLSQAIYDADRRLLVVSTDAGAPGAQGEPTTFRITNLSPQTCIVEADGVRSDDWKLVDGEIEISTTIGKHSFVIRCA
ncbi:hypothetical protein [Pseudorhodoplanes sp.]|uniref:linalool dehydratase/isomerase domain-containing protein n=1 Tax=Pseudorhodoplanes sp. TaxID=1934341 RepID=UPI003D0ECA73